MAFGTVTTGDTAQLFKPFFAFVGHRAFVEFTLPTNNNHISPQLGFMPARSTVINTLVNGGAQRLFLADVGGGDFYQSAQFSPGGLVNTTATRGSQTHAVGKSMQGGGTYWMGHVNESGTGVAFTRISTGLTRQTNSSWVETGTQFGGFGYFQMSYIVVPSVVRSPSGSASSSVPGRVSLSWTAPSNNGGTSITQYLVEWATNTAFSQNTGSTTTTSQNITLDLNPNTTYYFRISARNAVSTHFNNATGPRSSTVTITTTQNVPVWTDNTLANTGRVRFPYSDSVSATNTTNYAITSGALPPGITLDTSTGVVSGTPTLADNYTFTITASGPGGSISQAFSLQIRPSGTRFDENENPVNLSITRRRTSSGSWVELQFARRWNGSEWVNMS